LSLYYRGLRTTAAAKATLAELAFPATAAILGVTVFNTQLSSSQWAGFGVIIIAVTMLSWHERISKRSAVREPRLSDTRVEAIR